MKRTTVWLTEEQIDFLKSQGKETSEYIRTAIDWRRAVTVYIEDAIEMAEEVHPEFTYEQFQAWLLFRWRLRHEGKDHNGNSAEILAKVNEILALLKNDSQLEVIDRAIAQLQAGVPWMEKPDHDKTTR